MRVGELDDLFARLQRLMGAAHEIEGKGFEWRAKASDGVVHTYRIERMRSLERIGDDVAHLALWVWNTKDYLKQRARVLDRDPEEVERVVNASLDLRRCADIANTLKHGELSKNPRSGSKVRLGEPTCTFVPTLILAEAFKVTAVPMDLSAVEIAVPVLNESGAEVEQALPLFERSVSRWEELRASLEGTA